MRAAILPALLIATPATAQLSNPPPVASFDTSQLATKTDAQQSRSMADSALAASAAATQAANNAASAASAAATAAASALSSATAASSTASAACQPAAIIPPVEVPGGTPGSGTNCRLANAADNRITRTGLFTVGASGAILCGGSTTCAWLDGAGNPMPLPAGAASYPMFFTGIGAAGGATVRCKVASTTNAAFTGATCTQAVATVSILGAAVEIVAPTGTQVFALSLPSTQANR